MKLWILPLLVLLAACGRSPEEAQKKLAVLQVPSTEESLIAKTKDAKEMCIRDRGSQSA